MRKTVNEVLVPTCSFGEQKKGAFGKPCLWPRDTRHFRRLTVSSKTLVSLVRTQIRYFRRFRHNPRLFGGTQARFTKGTVFGTPTLQLV